MVQSADDSFVDSWPAHLATAALSGVFTTHLPVYHWSPRARWTLHGGMGVLAGGAMWSGRRRVD